MIIRPSMNFIKVLKIGLVASVFFTLSGCGNIQKVNEVKGLVPEKPAEVVESNIASTEYCFVPSDKVSLGMVKVTSSPEEYLKAQPDVLAAINGPYYSADTDDTLGVDYLDGNHYGDKRGRMTGYFIIDKAGQIQVSDTFAGKFEDYSLVIGTYPLLLKNGEVTSQAKEDRYNFTTYNAKPQAKLSFRSAIGTKSGKDVCFAVSGSLLTMQEWAEFLQKKDYTQALNLDGGLVSQLAVRQDGIVSVAGPGGESTRLVIFAK